MISDRNAGVEPVENVLTGDVRLTGSRVVGGAALPLAACGTTARKRRGHGGEEASARRGEPMLRWHDGAPRGLFAKREFDRRHDRRGRTADDLNVGATQGT